MLEIAVFVVVCVYLQIIINRDKRDRKRYEQIGRALDKEEKRRAKEEKLRSKRIKHPKVCYLDDYRLCVLSRGKALPFPIHILTRSLTIYSTTFAHSSPKVSLRVRRAYSISPVISLSVVFKPLSFNLATNHCSAASNFSEPP